jgi:sugar phosphate isomerase/epimerase
MNAEIELIAGYWTLAGDTNPFAKSEVSPFPLRDRIEAAASAGYRGIGLLRVDLLATTAKHDLHEIKSMLEHNGMRHVELEFLVDWFADGARRQASDAIRRDLLKAAAMLDARHIKVAPEIDGAVYALSRVVDEFALLCREAAEYGAAIALEMMPFSQINNFSRALSLVESAGASNGGLLLDLCHVARGGMAYTDVATAPTKRIVSVELDDADAEPHGSLWEDTLYYRRLCGEGALRPREFIGALRGAGYRGVYSVEIISREHRKRGLEEAARRSFETTMNQFGD